MWPPWVKIGSPEVPPAAPAARGVSASPLPRSPSFSLSTLKDVQALIRDDADEPFSSPPTSASTPSSPAVRRVFHRVRVASAALRFLRSSAGSPDSALDRRIVIYYTSLGVIRKTADDCRAVRSILRGLRVAVDERDLSMDSGFLAELKAALGPRRRGQMQGGQLSLPQVFIGGRYVGGADEIRRLHECGELRRLIEGSAATPVAVCEGCGGLRFVLCSACNGSRKLYSEGKGGVSGFRSCGECNQNGLVRCSDCCGPAF